MKTKQKVIKSTKKTLTKNEVDAVGGGNGAGKALAYAACVAACHFIFGGHARQACYHVCESLR